jgi:hypothetical protein
MARELPSWLLKIGEGGAAQTFPELALAISQAGPHRSLVPGLAGMAWKGSVCRRPGSHGTWWRHGGDTIALFASLWLKSFVKHLK